MRIETITREGLVQTTEAALLLVPELCKVDKAAIRHFVTNSPRVAAGAWCIRIDSGRCYCPVSGASVDRAQPGSRHFASIFDHAMGASGYSAEAPILFEVHG